MEVELAIALYRWMEEGTVHLQKGRHDVNGDWKYNCAVVLCGNSIQCLKISQLKILDQGASLLILKILDIFVKKYLY